MKHDAYEALSAVRSTSRAIEEWNSRPLNDRTAWWSVIVIGVLTFLAVYMRDNL